jgi:hypothetical protein
MLERRNLDAINVVEKYDQLSAAAQKSIRFNVNLLFVRFVAESEDDVPETTREMWENAVKAILFHAVHSIIISTTSEKLCDEVIAANIRRDAWFWRKLDIIDEEYSTRTVAYAYENRPRYDAFAFSREPLERITRALDQLGPHGEAVRAVFIEFCSLEDVKYELGKMLHQDVSAMCECAISIADLLIRTNQMSCDLTGDVSQHRIAVFMANKVFGRALLNDAEQSASASCCLYSLGNDVFPQPEPFFINE